MPYKSVRYKVYSKFDRSGWWSVDLRKASDQMIDIVQNYCLIDKVVSQPHVWQL